MEDTKLIDRVRASTVKLGEYTLIDAIENGRIIVFTVTGFTREATDTWAQSAMQIAREEEFAPVLTLHDFSAPSMSISPYSRHRSLEVVAFCREHNIALRYAVVIGDGLVSQTIRLFANYTVALLHTENIGGKIFTSRSEAVNYLKAFISE